MKYNESIAVAYQNLIYEFVISSKNYDEYIELLDEYIDYLKLEKLRAKVARKKIGEKK